MWVQKRIIGASIATASVGEPLGKKLQQKLEMKGKNCHMPFLNVTEHVFRDRMLAEVGCRTSCVEIQSPTQMLPQANAATVHNRWLKWTLLASGSTGEAVDSERRVLQHIRNIEWVTLIMQKDNLGLNRCLVALEQKKMVGCDADQVPSPSQTLLDLNCFGHTTVLCMKPLIVALGINSHLVRLGHILESGRSSDQYQEQLEKMVNSSFIYKPVDEFDKQALGWHQKTKRILEESRPARDLTEEDERVILAAISSNPDDDAHEHICPLDCPLGCGRNPATAKENYLKAVKAVAGGPMTVPLFSRWKGFEEAVAFARRGKRIKNCLPRGLKPLFGDAAVEKAQSDLQRLAASPNADNDMAIAACKKVIRGNKILQWLEQERDGGTLDIAVVLNTPLQKSLNVGFAAKRETGELTEVFAASSDTFCPKSEEDLRELEQRAIDRNLAILTGETSEQAIREYSFLIMNFGAPEWSFGDGTISASFQAVESLIVSIADCWFRCVFPARQPKIQILKVAKYSEYNEGVIHSVAQPILDKNCECASCVDPFFALKWASRLKHEQQEIRRRAHRSIRKIVATLPVMTTRTERKHLLGQEVGGRKRGRRVSGFTLAKATYINGVRKAAIKKQALAIKLYLGETEMIRQWTNSLQSFEVDRPQRLQLPIMQIPRGSELFAHEHGHEIAPGSGVLSRAKAVTAAWNALPIFEKVVFSSRAHNEAEVINDVAPGLGFRELVESRVLGNVRKILRTTLLRQAAVRTLDTIKRSPMWASGAGIDGFGTGLREEFVAQGSQASMKAACDRLINFDHRASEDFWKGCSMQPFECCEIRNYGLCEEDPTLAQCNTATKHLYNIMTQAKIAKKGPLVISLQSQPKVEGDTAHYFFFTRFIGRGHSALLVSAEFHDEDADVPHLAPKLQDGVVATYTSQLAVRHILHQSARIGGTRPSSIESMAFACFKTKRRHDRSYFAVQKIGFHVSPTIFSTKVCERAKRERENTVDLPFGLTWDPETQNPAPMVRKRLRSEFVA